MDFTLSDEQVLLRDTVRALLARECPPSLVRAVAEDPSAADPLWRHLGEWVALAEGPVVDLCLFLEACGAALVPGPLVPTVLALPVIRAVDPPAADRVAAGELTATVAMAGADGQWVPNEEPVRTFVLEADRVDLIAVVGAAGVAVLDASAVRDDLRFVPTLDWTRRAFELQTNQRMLKVLGGYSPPKPSTFGWWGAVVVAAGLLGTARSMLERTLAYARERVQFDVPIGSFQAIQHKLADTSLEVERATAAVYYAAMCLDAGDPEQERAASVAKAAAGTAAKRSAKDSIQVHGGIGYTWEHDLHLAMRRAYTDDGLFGTTAWHHDRLAELLLAPASPTAPQM